MVWVWTRKRQIREETLYLYDRPKESSIIHTSHRNTLNKTAPFWETQRDDIAIEP